MLIGGVDWISKKWLLSTFMEEEGLSWQDPWLQSLDLEYHNINPGKGLVFCVEAGKGHRRIQLRSPTGRINPDSTAEHPGQGPIPSSRAISKAKPPLHHQLGFYRIGKPGLPANAGSI